MTYPVQVGIRVIGHVIVEDNVHPLYVHTTAKQIGGHEDTLLEILELLVTGQSVNTRIKQLLERNFINWKFFPQCLNNADTL